MKAPTLFGGQNPENPFSVVNKVLRAGAGAVGGIATGNPLESARAAYHAPRGTTGVVEDTAMGLLLGKISPSVAAAPLDATAIAAQKTLSGAKTLQPKRRRVLLKRNKNCIWSKRASAISRL